MQSGRPNNSNFGVVFSDDSVTNRTPRNISSQQSYSETYRGNPQIQNSYKQPAPAIRQGLSVQELKAMTALRMAQSDSIQAPNVGPKTATYVNPASSYQTATPQQLEAAGIQPIIVPNASRSQGIPRMSRERDTYGSGTATPHILHPLQNIDSFRPQLVKQSSHSLLSELPAGNRTASYLDQSNTYKQYSSEPYSQPLSLLMSSSNSFDALDALDRMNDSDNSIKLIGGNRVQFSSQGELAPRIQQQTNPLMQASNERYSTAGDSRYLTTNSLPVGDVAEVQTFRGGNGRIPNAANAILSSSTDRSAGANTNVIGNHARQIMESNYDGNFNGDMGRLSLYNESTHPLSRANDRERGLSLPNLISNKGSPDGSSRNSLSSRFVAGNRPYPQYNRNDMDNNYPGNENDEASSVAAVAGREQRDFFLKSNYSGPEAAYQPAIYDQRNAQNSNNKGINNYPSANARPSGGFEVPKLQRQGTDRSIHTWLEEEEDVQLESERYFGDDSYLDNTSPFSSTKSSFVERGSGRVSPGPGRVNILSGFQSDAGYGFVPPKLDPLNKSKSQSSLRSAGMSSMGGLGGGQVLSPPPGLLGQSKPTLDVAGVRPFLGSSVGASSPQSLGNDLATNNGRDLFNSRSPTDQPLEPIAIPTNIVGRGVRVVDNDVAPSETVNRPPLLKAKSLSRLPPGLLSPLEGSMASEGPYKAPRRKQQIVINTNTTTAEDDSDDRSLSDQFLASEMAESVLFGSPLLYAGSGPNSAKSIGQRLNSLNRGQQVSHHSQEYNDNVSGQFYGGGSSHGYDDDALSDSGSYQPRQEYSTHSPNRRRQSYESTNESLNSRLINGAYGNQANLHPHTDVDYEYE